MQYRRRIHHKKSCRKRTKNFIEKYQKPYQKETIFSFRSHGSHRHRQITVQFIHGIVITPDANIAPPSIAAFCGYFIAMSDKDEPAFFLQLPNYIFLPHIFFRPSPFFCQAHDYLLISNMLS